MNISSDSPNTPPIAYNYDGKPRRVGVEIEFAQLSCTDSAKVVAEEFGGSITEHSEYKYDVKDTSLGTFAVEMDFSLVHKVNESADGEEEDDLGNLLKKSAGQVLGQVGDVVVPNEITCPPIKISDLRKIDALIRALSEAGALDTSEKLFLRIWIAVQSGGCFVRSRVNPSVPSKLHVVERLAARGNRCRSDPADFAVRRSVSRGLSRADPGA